MMKTCSNSTHVYDMKMENYSLDGSLENCNETIYWMNKDMKMLKLLI